MMHFKRAILVVLCSGVFCLAGASAALAASVVTDQPDYAPGDSVIIFGSAFLSGEVVDMQVMRADGSPCGGAWQVLADANTSFDTQWQLSCASDTVELMEVRAYGQASGEYATATFLVSPSRNLDQLQNGTSTSSPNWSNGNINTTNSCYSEGASVPYRYFITEMNGGDSHFFTIEMEWTKATIHAFDYLTDYDLSEADGIDSAGGPCGTISTTPPGDCATPSNLFAWPNFTDSSNYSGSIPGDFFPSGFSLDGPRNLASYNATVDSVSEYFFGGTASDRTLSVVVYFTVADTGSVGFFWGGHLSSGTPSTWGTGMGSASVGGAPYHMRSKNFDGGGGGGQDKSVQNGSVCLPPELTITCASASLDCTNLSSTCSVPDSADSYEWTVVGATIDSGQGTAQIYYTATASDSVIISLTACNASSGCPGSTCCGDDIAVVYITPNNLPTIAFGTDFSQSQCALTEICLPYSVSDPDGLAGLIETLISGPGTIDTLNNQVCFTPASAGTYTFIARVTDPCGATDEDTINVTVTVNSAPTISGPADQNLSLCSVPATITVKPFTWSDADGNIQSVTTNIGTLDGDSVVYTATDALTDTIIVTVTDSCGAFASDTVLVNKALNSPPTIAFGTDITEFQCTLAQICLPYTVSDPDGLTGVVETLVSGPGTIDTANNQICFTPASAGSYTFIARVTDPCGATDEDTINVTVSLNSAPTISGPADLNLFLCSVPATITVKPFTWSDADGNIQSVTTNIGTLDGDSVVYTANDAATDMIIVTVTDSCGVSAADTVLVNKTSNAPPVAACPGDTSVTYACTPSEICLGPFSASDPDGNLQSGSILSNAYGGSFDGTNYCFTPTTPGTYTIQYEALDACGATDTCAVTVTVNMVNTAPVATCPADTAEFQCAPAQICVGPFSATDSENNIESTSISFGSWSGSDVCFTPDTAGVYTIQYVVVDSCGLADTCQTQITVTFNQPPTLAFTGSDFSVFLCYAEPICLPYTVSDPDGASGLVETLVSGSGTIDTAANEVCFTPALAGDYTFIARVTDPCGEFSEDTITVTVVFNSPPYLTVPDDDTVFQCSAQELCYTIDFGDPDAPTYESNPTATLLSGTGSLSGTSLCFTPVDGVDSTYWFVIEVCDSCGSAGGVGEAVPPPSCVTDSFSVTVTFNQPPVASCPGDTTVGFTCQTEEVCVGPLSCSDPDGNGSNSYIIPNGYGGSFDGTDYCFTPAAAGSYLIEFVCEDVCGAADTCSVTVTVTIENSAPTVTCGSDVSLFQCLPETICVPGFTASDVDGNLQSATLYLGGSPLALSGDTACFLPDTSGVYDLFFEAIDSCGLVSSCHTYVTVELNVAPTLSLTPDTAVTLCDPQEICIEYSVYDPNVGQPIIVQIISGPGTVDTTAKQACFTPAAPGNYTITLEAIDSCGAADTATVTVTIELIPAPTIALPADFSEFRCNGDSICVDYTVTAPGAWGLVESLISGPGVIDTAANRVCFLPAASGVYTIIVGVTDGCGESDQDTITISVTKNSPPTITLGNDTTIFFCGPVNICLSYTVTDPDGPGGITEALVSGPGTIDTLNNKVCFTPPTAGSYTFVVSATDACGAVAADTIVVTAVFNRPPVAICPPAPPDTVLCSPGIMCVGPFTDSDLENNIVSRSAIGGTLDGSDICVNVTGTGSYDLIYVVTDACGESDRCTTTVYVTVLQGPICPQVNDTSIKVCEIREWCLPLNTTSIGQGGFTCEVISGPGDIVGDRWCYTPADFFDTVDVVVRCADDCGNVCTDDFRVAFYTDSSCVECPTLVLDTLSTLSNSNAEICLRVAGPSVQWGGFEFLINYDATVLTLNNVVPGNFILDCNWEYFTYRLVSTNPGLVRIVSIADLNNSNKHPSCFAPDSGDVVACFQFQVSNDRTLACQSVPLRFWWNDCSDNTISDSSGHVLLIAGSDPYSVIDPEGNDLTGLPSIGGPPIPCPTDKYEPFECLNFQNGKLRIICPNEIDDRGDLNLNGLAYEVADAVLYSNYLIYGSGVLDPTYFEAQIAASDVNGDGIPLTLTDLVYLIRVITGDAEPLPTGLGAKVGGSVGTVELRATQDAHGVTVTAESEHDIGGMLLTFAVPQSELIDVRAVDRAATMDLQYTVANGQLRVLLLDIGKARIEAGSGPIVQIVGSTAGAITLISAEAATYDGHALETEVAAKVVPQAFALHQNYPNPFNPSTEFAVDIPVRSEYVLTIYNITGQVVRTFEGVTDAGRLVLQWDGTNTAGTRVSSGVYFYRLQAGSFDAVRKMVLMK